MFEVYVCSSIRRNPPCFSGKITIFNPSQNIMSKQTTPEPSAPAKKAIDPIEKYEAVFASPPKPSVRLPRMGCFLCGILILLLAGALATGYYHSVGEVPTSFEIPEGAVTISDPEGVLLEEDQTKLESLAGEVAKAGDCSVALMFIDERFAEPANVFEQIAADWAPGKGVLLVQDVRGTSVRFGLIGDGWRLADWDFYEVDKEAGKYRVHERGARAIALLERLKHSILTAAKIPAGTEAATQNAQQAGTAPAKNPANMTDEELEKQMEAEEKAAAAELDAEYEDAFDDVDPEEMSVGMRAYAEKNKDRKQNGILYSNVTSRGGEGSAMRYALIFLGICVLIAFVSLKTGKSQRRRDLELGPAKLEEFKKKRASNKSLKLVDTNEFDDKGILRKKFLRALAVVLGILFGIGFVSSTLSEPVEKDVPRAENSLIPAAPLDGWRIVDQAEVFGEDGTAKLAAAIRHLEAQTGGEMMVLTVPTIGMTSIEDFGLETASKWKIGKAGVDNGALLVLAINDHLSRLEIGYGWEGPVNDGRAGELLRLIVPELRAEKYAEAAIKVVQGIEFYVTGVRPDGVTVEPGRQAAPKIDYVPEIKEFPNIAYTQPEHDPRILNPMDSMWGAVGVFGCLIAVLLAYWGRIVGTSAPHLVIYDPSAVHYSSSSGSSSGSSRSSRSSSRSYSSHSSSHHSGGGGGSFGGGGASGRW